MEVDSGVTVRKRPRPVYILLPLLLLFVVMAGRVAFRGESPFDPQSQMKALDPTSFPQAPASTDVPGDGIGLIAGPATPWAVAGGPGEIVTIEGSGVGDSVAAVATPVPIPIQGPPAGSFFRLLDEVTFYWGTSMEQATGRQFTVYLVAGEERIALGSVSEANLGLGYQLQAAPGRIVGEPGEYSWLVVLVDEASGAIIGQSETRPLTIVDDN